VNSISFSEFRAERSVSFKRRGRLRIEAILPGRGRSRAAGVCPTPPRAHLTSHRLGPKTAGGCHEARQPAIMWMMRDRERLVDDEICPGVRCGCGSGACGTFAGKRLIKVVHRCPRRALSGAPPPSWNSSPSLNPGLTLPTRPAEAAR
jgi:hypothetical protein